MIRFFYFRGAESIELKSYKNTVCSRQAQSLTGMNGLKSAAEY